MPIAKIQLPDGRIGRFEVPEGTTPEQVMSFAEQNIGELQPLEQQKTSTAGEVARPFLQAAKQIAVGTIGSAGDIAQEAFYAPEAIGRTGARAMGFDVEPFDWSKVNTVSPTIRESFDTVTGGLTEPRNKTEGVLETVGEIAGGIVGPAAIKTVAQKSANIAGFVGKRALQFGAGINKKSEELVKAFTDSGVRPTLANITEGKATKAFQNLVGNFPGGKGAIERAAQGQIDDITKQLAGITKSRGGTIQQTGKVIQEGAQANKIATEARISKLYDDLDQFIPKEGQKLYRGDFDRSAITTDKGGLSYSKNPEVAKNFSDSGDIKELTLNPDAKIIDISDLRKKILGVDKFPDPSTLSTKQFDSITGEALFKKAKELGFDAIDRSKVVTKSKGVRATNKLLDEQEITVLNPGILSEGGAKIPTNNLKALTQDAQIQDVVAVGSGDTAKVLARYNDIIDEAGNISYPRLKTFRSTVGAKMQSPSLLGEERGALKKIYGALSEDMKSAVTTQGGEKGLQAFNKANNNFIRATERIEKQINPLVNAKTPEKVYNLALSGTKQGGSNIKPIMRGLNPTQQEFVRGTVANRMGLAKVGQQDAAGEVFSPDTFLTEWNKLSPEARTNIFTKEQSSSINTLNKAIASIKEAGKARQTSNNLPYGAYLGLGALTVANPVVGAGSIAGANITSRMMTNSRFVKWLAQAPKVRAAEIPKHLKVLSTISGAGNAELREDILNYLDNITLEKE